MRYVAVVALFGLLALAGCGREADVAAPARPVGVQVAAPLEGVSGRRYTATLQPREQVAVAFRVGGYVEDILSVPGPAGGVDADRGAAVRRGQVLARLRTTDYQARVATARAALAEAVAVRRQAGIDLERLSTLLRSKAVAQADYDKARERADSAVAREEAARGRLAEALEQLRDTAIISPLSGVITRRGVERGTLATPGHVAYEVADLSRMKAVFGVPDVVVGALRPGAMLEVRVAALDRVMEGSITAVSPAADKRSRIFDVEIGIPNVDQSLKDGMSATVVLGAGEAGPLPAVPLAAVVRPAGSTEGYAVFVVERRNEADVAVLRTVQLGAVEGSNVELLEGVRVGEPVVVLGATLLRDGEPVKVLPGTQRSVAP